MGEEMWSVEARLPLTHFGVAAKPGQVWGLNFRRKQPGRKANADWQPISYDPHGLGLMFIKQNRLASDAGARKRPRPVNSLGTPGLLFLLSFPCPFFSSATSRARGGHRLRR